LSFLVETVQIEQSDFVDGKGYFPCLAWSSLDVEVTDVGDFVFGGHIPLTDFTTFNEGILCTILLCTMSSDCSFNEDCTLERKASANFEFFAFGVRFFAVFCFIDARDFRCPERECLKFLVGVTADDAECEGDDDGISLFCWNHEGTFPLSGTIPFLSRFGTGVRRQD
jgi:hypothetical protein